VSERLFIRLGRTAEQACSWLVWSEQEQEIIASGELANAQGLSTLTERAGNRPIDVLVPASAMTLTSVHLPEKGQRQALKALPFMLEESIADDVDAMHFTVGPRNGDALSVVAVAHEQMQTWLSCLAEANELLLRTGLGTGHSLPLPWLPVAMKQLTAQAEELSVASYSEMQLDGVELLLTGVYTPKREYSKHLLQWKNAAIVLAVAIVLSLVNKGLTIHQVNGQIADLKAQSEAIYQQVVPGNTRIVNLRSQMESQLRSLQGQGSGAEFFSMLAGLQDAFKQVPELKPNSLRFESARNEIRMQVTAKNYAEIRMQVTAKNYAQIEKFKEIVGRRFQMDGGTMNSGEEKVTSTLTLRSK